MKKEPTRKQVCDQIYKLFTTEEMWSTLKNWWLNNGECKEFRAVLDAVAQGETNGNIIVKHSDNAARYVLLPKSLLKKYKESLDE